MSDKDILKYKNISQLKSLANKSGLKRELDEPSEIEVIKIFEYLSLNSDRKVINECVRSNSLSMENERPEIEIIDETQERLAPVPGTYPSIQCTKVKQEPPEIEILECSPSNANTAKISKRRRDEMTLNHDSKDICRESKKQKTPVYCLCERQFNDQKDLEQHLEFSLKHKRKMAIKKYMAAIQERESFEWDIMGNRVLCLLCKIKVNWPFKWSVHVASKCHKSKMASMLKLKCKEEICTETTVVQSRFETEMEYSYLTSTASTSEIPQLSIASTSKISKTSIASTRETPMKYNVSSSKIPMASVASISGVPKISIASTSEIPKTSVAFASVVSKASRSCRSKIPKAYIV